MGPAFWFLKPIPKIKFENRFLKPIPKNNSQRRASLTPEGSAGCGCGCGPAGGLRLGAWGRSAGPARLGRGPAGLGRGSGRRLGHRRRCKGAPERVRGNGRPEHGQQKGRAPCETPPLCLAL